MATLASEVMQRARRLIQDETSVRWPLDELRLWLNDAMREVALQKPTATSKTVIIPLVAGTFQAVPVAYMSLFRVVRNMKSSSTTARVGGRAIRAVAREVLDAQNPDWHDTTIVRAASMVKHIVFDPTEPMVFYVYPGNDGTGLVEAIVNALPVFLAKPTGDLDAIESYEVAIDMQDIYANVLLDYVLYRAYMKDAQFAGNGQRAQAAYQSFAQSLGVKLQTEMMANPNAMAPTPGAPTTAAVGG